MYKGTKNIIQNKIITYVHKRSGEHVERGKYHIPVKGTRRRHDGSRERSFYIGSPDGPGISVRAHIANALDIGVIDVPLEAVPPGERLHAPADHELPSEYVRPRLDELFL